MRNIIKDFRKKYKIVERDGETYKKLKKKKQVKYIFRSYTITRNLFLSLTNKF